MEFDIKKFVKDLLSQAKTMDDPITVSMLISALNDQGMAFAGDVYNKLDVLCKATPECVVCKKLLEELNKANAQK